MVGLQATKKRAAVDDPSNGLLVAKPFEDAVDDSHIAFEQLEMLRRVEATESAPAHEEKAFTYRMIHFDETSRNMKVMEYANLHCSWQEGKGAPPAAAAAFGDTTFGDHESLPLVSMQPANQPSKTCLSFHARQPLRRAKKMAWLPDDRTRTAEVFDYASQGKAAAISSWLNDETTQAPAGLAGLLSVAGKGDSEPEPGAFTSDDEKMSTRRRAISRL